jgi:hypothetical protein
MDHTKVIDSSVSRPVVQECIARVARGLAVPVSEQPAVATYVFELVPPHEE